MPLPLIIGGMALGGGAGLIAWYFQQDRKRREQIDDRGMDAIEKICGVCAPNACDTEDEKRRVINMLKEDGTLPER